MKPSRYISAELLAILAANLTIAGAWVILNRGLEFNRASRSPSMLWDNLQWKKSYTSGKASMVTGDGGG